MKGPKLTESQIRIFSIIGMMLVAYITLITAFYLVAE